jgi:small conductance mechanosensitive channel
LLPKPFINISDFKDTCVELILRVWCDTSNYWDLYYLFKEEVKKEFDRKGIELFINKIKILEK